VRADLQAYERQLAEREIRYRAKHWSLRTMAGALSRDHFRRSPGCLAKKMTEVMIPFSGGRVGDAPKC